MMISYVTAVPLLNFQILMEFLLPILVQILKVSY